MLSRPFFLVCTMPQGHDEVMSGQRFVWPFQFGNMLFRERLPSETTVFWIFLLSVVLHAPFAIRFHLTVGTSEAVRDLWRTLDIFFIFTCSGNLLFPKSPSLTFLPTLLHPREWCNWARSRSSSCITSDFYRAKIIYLLGHQLHSLLRPFQLVLKRVHQIILGT